MLKYYRVKFISEGKIVYSHVLQAKNKLNAIEAAHDYMKVLGNGDIFDQVDVHEVMISELV